MASFIWRAQLNNFPGRSSVRYYVHTDGQLFRLRSADYFSLIRGEVKLPELADGEMRIVEVIVSEAGNSIARSLRGLIHHFTSDGTLDTTHAAEAVELALLQKQLLDKGSNVVSLVPDLERRAWDKRHMWAVDEASVQEIDQDLSKKTKLPTLKLPSASRPTR